MSYFKWIIGGFALLYLAGAIETVGGFGQSPGERLPFYFVALAVLLGAGYCFVRGGRGAWAAMPWNSGKPKARAEPQVEHPIPARRKGDLQPSAPEAGFDVDAAFARYMANRPEDAAETVRPETTQEQSGAPSFGRKGL